MAEQPFLGTQARILITEWQIVAKLVAAHSITSKEKAITKIEDLESFDIENLENITFSTQDELPNILTEKQLQIALQGPYGSFLKEKITAFAKITRLRLEVHLSKDELFKDKRIVISEEEKISPKKISKLNFEKLDQAQQELSILTETHHQEWQEFIEDWTNQLLNFLYKSQLSLTEREMDELKSEDIANELLPRFIEVGVKLPKKYLNMSFYDYLYLKSLLVIQSALSRQHLSHDDNELQQKLKGFKNSFAQMVKQEQQLLEEQKKMTEMLLSALD